MAKKIVLFLSTLTDNAQEYRYRCPDGGEVTGSQTNEGPVRYLLRRWPEVSEILCFVTKAARESAWEWFCMEVLALAPAVRIIHIPYDEKIPFTDGPMQELLAHIGEGDEILLETTGGFRNVVMDLLLISRVLSYTGVRTLSAVYARKGPPEIVDAAHLIREFDLVGGMQEFSGFGSTRTLRTYYGAPAEDAKIEALLAAAEKLLDCISLCRTEQLEVRLKEFTAALDGAENCADPLMKMLLPAFRKKYGANMNVLSLILWCVRSDMLQQALTIYKERIPAYLLNERKDLFTLAPGAPKGDPKDYQSPEETKLLAQFESMGRNVCKRNADHYALALMDLEQQLPLSHIEPHCSYSKLRAVFFDYFYFRTLRNLTNHASDTVTTDRETMERTLTEAGYPPFRELDMARVKKLLHNAMEHLRKENNRK